jgi:hypothetical protein
MTAPLQSAVPSLHGVGNVAATFGTNLTAGTKLLAFVQVADPSGGIDPVCTGVSDGGSGSFSLLSDVPSSGNPGSGVLTQHSYIWELDTPAGDAGTKPTITAVLSGGAGAYGDMLVQEVPGLLPGSSCMDGTPGTLAGSATAGYSTGTPAYASSAAGEYLVAFYADNGGSGIPPSWTAPAGYTADPNAVNSQAFGNIAVCYKDSTGGTESDGYAVANSTFDLWGLVLVAFQLASTDITGTAALALAPMGMAAAGSEVIAGHASLALAPLKMALAGTETGADVSGTLAMALAPLKFRVSAGGSGGRAQGVTGDDRSAFKRRLLW